MVNWQKALKLKVEYQIWEIQKCDIYFDNN